jgi:biotin transport system substrate-specific component
MDTAVRRETMLDAIVPSLQGVRMVIMALGFSVIIGLSARLIIPLPFTPVPVTMQTFAVLLTGAMLGPRLGGLAVLFYLMEGSLGLPVFRGGTSGIAGLVGPTGGYLIGFIVAAWIVGSLVKRRWDRRFGQAFAMMLVGEAVILALGSAWLARFVGAENVLMAGVVPFIPGALAKAGLAAALLPLGWKALAALRE